MKQKSFYALVAVIGIVFALSSCMKSEDNTNLNYLGDYFTITGANPIYDLYSDHGVIVHPSIESVNELTQSAGFGDHKRIYLIMSYKNEDVITGTSPEIKNATLMSGSYMMESKTMTVAEADEKGLTKADSLFVVEKFSVYDQDYGTVNPWAGSKQYLNIPYTAGYIVVNEKAVTPTFNIWYDVADFKENAATVTFGYNRHCKQDETKVYGNYSFYTTFPMDKIIQQVPGTDSVTVTVMSKDKTPFTVKMARR